MSDFVGFDYNTVFHQMTQDEIDRANVALEIQVKAMKSKK